MRWVARLALVATCATALVARAQEPSPADADVETAGVASDEERALEARLTRALSFIDGLEDVRVRARSGAVRLEGRATSASARTAAREIATQTPGVVHVVNELSLPDPDSSGIGAEQASAQDQAIEERLRGILSQVEALRDVDATVQSGIVRLEGPLPSVEAQEAALDLARGLDGVVYVDDRTVASRGLGDRLDTRLRALRDRGARAISMLPQIALAFVIVVAFAMFASLVRRSDAWLRPFVRQRLLRGIIRRVAALVILGIGAFFALEVVGATTVVGALLGTAGVLGIILGLAFRDIAENYLASILLGVRRPFAAKDHVVIDGHEGRVVRLTTRETQLLTLDGHHVSLPNAAVYKAVIVNYTSNPLRRFDVIAGAGAHTDLRAAQEVGLEALRGTSGVVADPPPFVRFEPLGPSDVQLRFHAWVDQREHDWAKVRSESVRRVKRACDAIGLEVPPAKHHIEVRRRAQLAPTRDAREDPATPAHDVTIDHVIEEQIDRAAPSPDEDLLARE